LLSLAHRHCFDLFGLDIIITEDYAPVILEVNKAPSMKVGWRR